MSTVKKGNWFSNFGKSVAFSAIDVIGQELMPQTARIVDGTNAEFVSGIMDTLGQIRRGQTKLTQLFEKNQQAKDVLEVGKQSFSDLWEDVKHFAKTGEVTRPESEDEDFGFDMNFGDEDLGFDEGDLNLDDLPSPDELKGTVSKNATPLEEMTATTGSVEIAAINDQTRALVAAEEVNAQAIAQVGKITGDQTSILGGAILQGNKIQAKTAAGAASLANVLQAKTMKGLETINGNVAALVAFNNDTVAKEAMAAMKYYDDSLNELKNIGEILNRAFPSRKKQERESSDFDKAGMSYGGFDLPGYLEVVKKNFLYNTQVGMLVEMFADPEMLKGVLENPLKMITETAISSLIPQLAKTAMRSFDETFSNFFPAVASKLYQLGNSFDANPILQFLGSVFGIAPPSTYKNLRGYEKGPVPFDGITHRTINHVIPTYLSQIVALLGGSERQMYNHEMGRFETVTQMKESLHNEEMQSMKNAVGYDVLDQIDTRINQLQFDSKKEADEMRKLIHEGLLELVKSGNPIDPYNINFMDSEKLSQDIVAQNVLRQVFGRDLDKLGKYDSLMKIGAATHQYAQNQYVKNQMDRPGDNRALVTRDNFGKQVKLTGVTEETEEERRARLAYEDAKSRGSLFDMAETARLGQVWQNMKKKREKGIKEEITDIGRKDIAEGMIKEFDTTSITNILGDTYKELKSFHQDFLSSLSFRSGSGGSLGGPSGPGIGGSPGSWNPLGQGKELIEKDNYWLLQARDIIKKYQGAAPAPGSQEEQELKWAQSIQSEADKRVKNKRKEDEKKKLEAKLASMGLTKQDYKIKMRAKKIEDDLKKGKYDPTDENDDEGKKRKADYESFVKQVKKEIGQKTKAYKESKEAEEKERKYRDNPDLYTEEEIEKQKKEGKVSKTKLERSLMNAQQYGGDEYIDQEAERVFANIDEKIERSLDKTREEQDEVINNLENNSNSFFGNIGKMLRSPFSTISFALRGVEKTLVGLVFGTSKRDKGFLQVITDNIKSTFDVMKKTIKEEFYNPLKKILFGEANFKDSPLYQSFQSGIGKIRAFLNEDYDEATKDDKAEEKRKARESDKLREAKSKRADAIERMKKVKGILGTYENLLGVGGEHHATGTQGTRRIKATPGEPIYRNGKIVRRVKESGIAYLKDDEYVGKPPYSTNSQNQIEAKQNAENEAVKETISEAFSSGTSDIVKEQEETNKKLDEANKLTREVVSKTDEGNKIVAEAAKDKEDGSKKKTDTESTDEKKKPNSIAQNFKDMMGEIGRNVSAHLFGESKDKDGKQKPIMENIGDMFAKGARNFSNYFFGTNYDTEEAVDKYKVEMKKSVPRGVARGLVLGGGLGLTSMAGTFGGFGLLGSIFLPGGIIGSMILGLGAGLALESEGFKKWLFGEKDNEGKRTGGKISRKTLDWFEKNKKALIGGAAVGLWSGITHLGPMNLLASLLPGGGGALTALALGAIGPVTLSVAAALALNSEKFQEKLFGKKDALTGKRAGGLAHTNFMKEMRKRLPNVAAGAAIGGIAALAGSQFGILGGLMIGPYAGAVMGGVTGFMLSSKKFKEALFGVQDKDGKFIKGGLVDKVQNFFTAEVINPLTSFAKKEIFRASKWFTKKIFNPLSDAVLPFKMLINSIMNQTKKTIETIIGKITGQVKSLFSPIINVITRILGGLARGLRDTSLTLLGAVSSLSKTILSAPVKLISAPAAMLRGYYRHHGTDEQKALISEQDKKREERDKEQEKEWKEREKELEREESHRKDVSKMLRKRGYAATEAQLQAKTDEYLKNEAEKKAREEQKRLMEDQMAIEAEQKAIEEEQLVVAKQIYKILSGEDQAIVSRMKADAKLSDEDELKLERLSKLEANQEYMANEHNKEKVYGLKSRILARGLLASEEDSENVVKLNEDERKKVTEYDKSIKSMTFDRDKKKALISEQDAKKKTKEEEKEWKKRKKELEAEEKALTDSIKAKKKEREEFVQTGLYNAKENQDLMKVTEDEQKKVAEYNNTIKQMKADGRTNEEVDRVKKEKENYLKGAVEAADERYNISLLDEEQLKTLEEFNKNIKEMEKSGNTEELETLKRERKDFIKENGEIAKQSMKAESEKAEVSKELSSEGDKQFEGYTKKEFIEKEIKSWSDMLREDIHDILTSENNEQEIADLKASLNLSGTDKANLAMVEKSLGVKDLSKDSRSKLLSMKEDIYHRGLLASDKSKSYKAELTSVADEMFTSGVKEAGIKGNIDEVRWDPNADVNERDMRALSAQEELARRKEQSWRDKLYNVLTKQLGVQKGTIAKAKDWFDTLKDLLMGLLGMAGVLGALEFIKNIASKIYNWLTGKGKDESTMHDERIVRDLAQLAARTALKATGRDIARAAARGTVRDLSRDAARGAARAGAQAERRGVLSRARSFGGAVVDSVRDMYGAAKQVGQGALESVRGVRDRAGRFIAEHNVPGTGRIKEAFGNLASGFLYGPADKFDPQTGMYKKYMKVGDKWKYVDMTREDYFRLGDFNSRTAQIARYNAQGGITGMAWNKVKSTASSAKERVTKFAKDWTWDSKLGKWIRGKGTEGKGIVSRAVDKVKTKAKDIGKTIKAAPGMFWRGADYIDDTWNEVAKGDRLKSLQSGKKLYRLGEQGITEVVSPKNIKERWLMSGGLKGNLDSLKKEIGEWGKSAGKFVDEMKKSFIADKKMLEYKAKKMVYNTGIVDALNNTVRDVKIGAEMIYQDVRNIGYKTADGGEAKLGHLIDKAKNIKEYASAKVSQVGGAIKSTAESVVNKVKDTKIGEKMIEGAKKGGEGLYDFFMKNCMGALDVIKNNDIVKKILGADVGKLLKKIKEQIVKCTPEIFKFIAQKVGVAVSKTAAFVGSAGGAQLLFSLYDIYSGVTDAAEMWKVKEEDLTAGMKTACVILNVLMGLGPMVWVDLALEAVYLGSSFVMGEESAINVKQILLKLIYDCLPNAYDSAKIDELQKKQRAEYDKYLENKYNEAYQRYKEGGGDASFDDWKANEELGGAVEVESYDQYIHNQNKHSMIDDALNAARKTSLGRWLFGGEKDENGNVKQGALLDAKDWLFGNDEKGITSAFTRAGTWLFGTDELDENGNLINKGVVGEFVDTVSSFIEGVSNFFTQAKRFIFDMDMDERLTTIWKLLIGGEDDKGEYKLGVIPKLWGVVEDFGNAAIKQFNKVKTIFSTYAEDQNPIAAAVNTVSYLIKSFLGWEDDSRGVIVQSISRFLHMDIFKGPSDFFDQLGTKFDGFMADIDKKGVFGVLGDMLIGLLGWDRNDDEDLVDVALRKFWDEGLKPTIDDISQAITDFGKRYKEIWKIYMEEISTQGPWSATMNFLKRFLGFEPETGWKDILKAAITGMVNKVESGINAISDKFEDLRDWWKEFSLIETIKDALLWPLKKFSPGFYEAVMNTINFGGEAEGDASKYAILKERNLNLEDPEKLEKVTEFHRNKDKEYQKELERATRDLELASSDSERAKLQQKIDMIKNYNEKVKPDLDKLLAEREKMTNEEKERIMSEYNKQIEEIDRMNKEEKEIKQQDEDNELAALRKKIKDQEKGGSGLNKLSAKHKNLLGGGAEVYRDTSTIVKPMQPTLNEDSVYILISKLLHKMAGQNAEEVQGVKESIVDINQSFKFIGESILNVGNLFTTLGTKFVSDNKGKGIIDISKIFLKDFIGFEVGKDVGKTLNDNFNKMMVSINTHFSSITKNFDDATKWWKSFSLAKTSKEVILGSVKTISTKLYEAINKLPDIASTSGSSGISLSDDIKKILDQIKTTAKNTNGGGSGTSYAKTSTMQELGCGPTVATNALFGTSYTQNDPRWANKTLMGGGAGVDPYTFARSTVDETNLADDSSGTKGVTPDYFRESAAKVGKEIIDVSTRDMSAVPAGTRMILGSNQHYENATMLGNGLMSVHDPNFEGEYITSVADKAREIEQSPDLKYAGAVLGGGAGEEDKKEEKKEEPKNPTRITLSEFAGRLSYMAKDFAHQIFTNDKYTGTDWSNYTSSSNANNAPAQSGTNNAAVDASNLQGNDNASKIWNFLKGQGIHDIGIAGIMGNLKQESQYDPMLIEGGERKDLEQIDWQGAPGYGLAQWTYYSRQEDLNKYAKSKGKHVSDLGTQLEFMVTEPGRGPEAVEAVKKATTVHGAADAWEHAFENAGTPMMENRYKYADEAYAAFANKGGGKGTNKARSKKFGGGSIKSWVLKQLSGLAEGTAIDKAIDMLDNFPRLAKLLEAVDTFTDPLSILMLPYNKAKEIDEKIARGEINIHNIQSYIEDDNIYSAGGGRGLDRIRYNKFGGGNELKMEAQGARDCTTYATKALYKAYLGKEGTHIGSNWNSVLLNELKVSENPFSENQKTEFEKKVSDHFYAHPDYPIFLYQTGGLGREGTHPLNAGEGNHATLIGRKLKSGQYEIYNPAGARIHKIDLGKIFDPSAKGGSVPKGAAQGMKPGEGNMLWIPTIAPSSPITQWMSNDETAGINVAPDANKPKLEITGSQKILQEAAGMKGWKVKEGAKGLAEPDKKLTTDLQFIKDAMKFANIDFSSANSVDDLYATFKSKNALFRPEDARPGDIVFLADTDKAGKEGIPFDGKLTTAGIYTGDGKILIADPSKGVTEVRADGIKKYIKSVGSIKVGFNVPNLLEEGSGRIESEHPAKEAKKSPVKDEDCVKKKEAETPGLIAQAAKGTMTLSEFASKLAYLAKDFAHQIFTKGKYTGTDWGSYNNQGSVTPQDKNPDNSPSAPTNDSMSEKEIWDWFKSKGYNDEATAGIMGRVKQEHNFNPKMSAEKIRPYGGGDIGGMGIFQWTWDTAGQNLPDPSLPLDEYFKKGREMHPDSRLASYLKWCDENNKPYESTASELEYFWTVDKDFKDQLYFAQKNAGIPNWNPETLNKFKRAEVVKKWTDAYERGSPSANDEIYTNELFEKYASRGGGKRRKLFGGGGPTELSQLLNMPGKTVSFIDYKKAATSGEGLMNEGYALPLDKEYEMYKTQVQKLPKEKPSISSLLNTRGNLAEEPNPIEASHDEFGNMIGVDIPEYNKIKPDDSIMVINAKKEAQRKMFGGGAASTTAETDPAKKDEHGLDSEAPRGLPLYRQYDTRWGSHMYHTGDLAHRGCGPTSMAMVSTWVTGKDDITPNVVSDYSAQNNFSVAGQGTDPGMFDSYAKTLGFNVKEIAPKGKEEVDAALAKGPIINSQGPGKFTGGGHYIVVAGKRSDGSYIVYDPYGAKNPPINPTSKITESELFTSSTGNWIPEGHSRSLEANGNAPANNANQNGGNTPVLNANSNSPLDGMSAIASISASIGSIAQSILFKSLGLNADPGSPNANGNVPTQNADNNGNQDNGGAQVKTFGDNDFPKVDAPGHGISDMKRSNFTYNEELTKRAKTDAISIHHSSGSGDETAASIHEDHKKRPDGNGGVWAGIGYNLVIIKNGQTEEGRPINMQGAHTNGSLNNSHVVGICLPGNFNDHLPTDEQLQSLTKSVAEICLKYNIPCDRQHVTGHREWDDDGYHGPTYQSNDCPGHKLYAKLDEIVANAKKLVDEYNAKKQGGGKKKDLKAKLKEIKGSEFMLPQQEEKLGGGIAAQGQQRVKKALSETRKTRKELQGLFDSSEFKSMSSSSKFGGGVETRIDYSKRPELFNNAETLSKRYGIKFDENLNVQGIDIPDEIKITDLSDKDKFIKQEHQIALYMKKKKIIDNSVYDSFYKHARVVVPKQDKSKEIKTATPAEIAKQWNVTFDEFRNVHMEDFKVPEELKITSKDDMEWSTKQRKQLEMYDKMKKKEADKNKPAPKITGPIRNSVADFFGKGKGPANAVEVSKEEKDLEAKIRKHGILFDTDGNIMMEGFKVPEELKLTDEERKNKEKFIAKQNQQITMYLNSKPKLDDDRDKVAKSMFELDENLRPSRDDVHRKEEIEKKLKEKDKPEKGSYSTQRQNKFGIKFDEIGNIHIEGFEIPEELKITEQEKTDRDAFFSKQTQQVDLWIKNQAGKKPEKRQNFLQKGVNTALEYIFGDLDRYKQKEKKEYKVEDLNSFDIADIYDVKFDEFGNVMMEGFTVPNNLRITKEEVEKSKDDKDIKSAMEAKQHEQLVLYAKAKDKNLLDKAKQIGIDPKKMNKALGKNFLQKGLDTIKDFFGIGQMVGKLEKSKEEIDVENKIKKYKIMTDSFGNIMMNGFTVPAELRINSDEKANSEIYNNKLQKQVELFTRRKADELMEEMKKIQAKKTMFGQLQDEREKERREKEKEEEAKKQTDANKIAVKDAHFNTQRENKYGLLFDENGNIKIPSFEVPQELRITEDEKKSRDTYFVKRMQQIDMYVKYKDEERHRRDEENAAKRKAKKGILGDFLLDKDRWRIGDKIETDEYEILTPAEIAKKFDVQFDDLGNVMMEGFEIPEDIKITKDDDEKTKFSKQRRQLEMLYDQDRTKKREERYAKELKYNELNPKPGGLLGKTQNWLKDLIGGFFGKGKLTEFKVEKSREELLIDAKVKKYGIKFDPLGNVMMPGFTVPDELKITEAEKNSSNVYDNKQLQQVGMYNEKAKKELEKQLEEARKKMEEANRVAKEKEQQEQVRRDEEQRRANNVARDKRLENEVDRRTREYKLQYDEFGNLKMPGFDVPEELKITTEERQNKVSLLNKKLQQIDMYLEFKEQQEQARRDEEERKRREQRELEARIRENERINKPQKPELQPEPRPTNIPTPPPAPEPAPIPTTPQLPASPVKLPTTQVEVRHEGDRSITRVRGESVRPDDNSEAARRVREVEEARHRARESQLGIKPQKPELQPEPRPTNIPTPPPAPEPAPIPTTPQLPASPVQAPITEAPKLTNVILQDTDYITGMTLGIKGVSDHSTQPLKLSKDLNSAGFKVIRYTRPGSDLYSYDIRPSVSPGRDATNMVNSIKNIVASSGLILDDDTTRISATASGTGGYGATLTQLAGNYSIENIISERNKKYGGGINFASLLKLGSLVHGASQAGLFGRSTENRKHRGIGGFFEGMFGGLFGRKKKEEPQQTTEVEEAPTIEEPKERKHGSLRGLFGKWFGKKNKKEEPQLEDPVPNTNEIENKPAGLEGIRTRDELRAYYEQNVQGKLHEEEYNKVDFDDDRYDIDILRDKIMKTEELNRQIEIQPKPIEPVVSIPEPEPSIAEPSTIISEPVPQQPEPTTITPKSVPVKSGPVIDLLRNSRQKMLEEQQRRIREGLPPITRGGSGVDPLKLARTTVNESNLADSSTGTRGVTPSFFDQAANKYGKHIKQIDVNNDNEIKSALDSGKELIAGGREFGGSSLFSNTGHYINMKGIGGGSVEVRDPSGVSYVTDINNLLPGIRNPEGPNYMGQVGGGASDFDMEEVQKKINEQEKKNKQNLKKFGAGAVEGEVQVMYPNSSIGDNYVSSTMSTDTNELLEAVRSLNIKPEMSELITYVKMLVTKQDDIVTTLSRYGGGYKYGGGSDSPTSSHDSQSNSAIPMGSNIKPDNPNGRKPGSIKVDQKKNFENAMKIARASGFS